MEIESQNFREKRNKELIVGQVFDSARFGVGRIELLRTLEPKKWLVVLDEGEKGQKEIVSVELLERDQRHGFWNSHLKHIFEQNNLLLRSIIISRIFT